VNKQELANELWSAVEQVARGFGLGIGSDCESLLREFITTGVNRIEQEGLLSNQRRIAEAETHLIAFVGGMAHEAKMQNLSMLRERTFMAAKSSFCPLWPFC
jgi:hypothetical protein